MTVSFSSGDLSERIAETVGAHPSVVRLTGGEFGVLATHAPGRRVIGVRVGERGEPVEVAVVLRLNRALPETIGELRTRVVETVGQGPVDITVADVLVET